MISALYSGVYTSRRCFSVAIAPGSTAFTRIPSGPSSCASVRVSPTMAAFAAMYTGTPVEGIIHAIEDILMMLPRPAAFIAGNTAWIMKNCGRKFTAIEASQYSGVTSSIVCR